MPGSFRDPAGHVFLRDDVLYRLVEPAGRAGYDQLMRSGLYESLASRGLLIPHADLGDPGDVPAGTRLLQPVRVPMVSYPYEWAFSAFKDAALLTLAVQRDALRHGMTLKDASAFNVLFDGSRPIFIDTLSFEPARPGPWRAYRQFCQHFLAPLALMAFRDVRLGKLLRLYPDGVPLDLASSLLPLRTLARPGILMHIHLHALAERRLAHQNPMRFSPRLRSDAGQALVDSLQQTIDGLSCQPASDWTAYEQNQPSYTDTALEHKERLVDQWLAHLAPTMVWDLGANTGRYSRLAASHGAYTVALDEDPACVETLYTESRRDGIAALLPLVIDLAAPSPANGWANEERSALPDRGEADLLLALALVHHLAVGRNVPLAEIARFMARLGRSVIVEFVPKSDPMVQRLLVGRDDVIADYTREEFERSFGRYFRTDVSVTLESSARTLYLMTRR